MELSRFYQLQHSSSISAKFVSVGGGCWEERVDVERHCYLKVKVFNEALLVT